MTGRKTRYEAKPLPKAYVELWSRERTAYLSNEIG